MSNINFDGEPDGDVRGDDGNDPLARVVQSRTRRNFCVVAVIDNLDHRVRPGEEALRRVSKMAHGTVAYFCLLDLGYRSRSSSRRKVAALAAVVAAEALEAV